jgi:octaprenyl-diphosphate synthase
MTSRSDVFETHLANINERLKKLLEPRLPMAEKIGKYILMGNGKRLRPLFFVLAANLCNYRGNEIYNLSTVFEYIHAASLLHDDVLDNSELRRKKPSANFTWGNHAAVLGGDFLCARAFCIATSSRNALFINKVADTLAQLVEGQLRELMNINNLNLTKEEYLNVVIDKTAVLMSAACAGGGIVSGAKDEEIKRLENFGLNLGVAFQFMDDLMDYTSSEEIFGKPVGRDLRDGKITLPLIYALADLDHSERKRLEGLFSNPQTNDEACRRLLELVRSSGAVDRVRKKAFGYVEKARDCLAGFVSSPEKTALMELNMYVIQRNR